MKIYTYGVIDSNIGIEDSNKGIEGAHVYNIPYRDIGIAVSDLDERYKKNVNPDHILKHEEVAERLMERFTVLPMKFFTIFKNKEEILSMMSEYYDSFNENLDRLRGKLEFGLKVIWSGNTIKKRIAENNTGQGQSELLSNGSLAQNYVMEKFEKYKTDRQFKEEGHKYISTVNRFFSGFAVEEKLNMLKSEGLLLTASYLVEKAKQDDFKQAFERLKKNGPNDLKYLFSGPWPPYNFINLTKSELKKV